MAADERTVEEKGRVTIPKAMRESLGLEPGDRIHVEVADGHVLVRPSVSREEFIAMAGCINDETRREDAEEIDPTELKKIWTGDLPSE